MKIGVWTPFRASGSLGPPAALPLGRAALSLQAEGIELIIGQPSAPGVFTGFVAHAGGWSPAEEAVSAVYDRFPSASQPEAFAAGLALIGAVPLANPPSITVLCRDKWRCQQALQGLAQPEAHLTAFDAHVRAWGAAFLKPRFGSFGRGVRRVLPGDALPEADGDWVLQRAIVPPQEFGAGLALRVLVQWVDAGWLARPAVARIDPVDPVVNAARGAELAPAEDRLPAQVLERVNTLAVQAAERLAQGGEPVVELGIDIVLDTAFEAWIIEVNSRPRGRLRGLAELHPSRYAKAHEAACMAPFRNLADTVASG